MNIKENYAAKWMNWCILFYAVTKKFPKHEMYGATSQLRRAILSVILNYIEGYSRFRTKTTLLFFETS